MSMISCWAEEIYSISFRVPLNKEQIKKPHNLILIWQNIKVMSLIQFKTDNNIFSSFSYEAA